MKAKKPVLGAYFLHISGSIGPIVSKNNRAPLWVDPHLPYEFHENRFKTATCIVRSCTYISNQDRQNKNRDHSHSPPSEVKDLRIVAVSYRNMAKKKKNSVYTIYGYIIMEYSGSGMKLKILIRGLSQKSCLLFF